MINDLSTDQRVHKHCMLLVRKGYGVLLIGRQTSQSVPLEQRPYETYRMRLPFEKGPLFYAWFNLMLFFQLLVRKSDLLFSNDLDTLLPNFLVSRLKRRPLVYDSHEFFTEVPELSGRPVVQRIWQWFERLMVPKLKYMLTVNASIASLYQERYGVEMKVLRNIPNSLNAGSIQEYCREELGLPIDRKVIILQGSGINMHRGAEEAVEAMQYVQQAVLLILGSGDVVPQLKQRVSELNLSEQVIFKDRMPYAQMMAHTRLADLGLSLDKDTNINYRYSLPNKIFDYIHAGIPVLGSDLVEVRRVIEQYGVGEVVRSFEPQELAMQMQGMLSSKKYPEWTTNAKLAAAELNYEKESEVLASMLHELRS